MDPRNSKDVWVLEIATNGAAATLHLHGSKMCEIHFLWIYGMKTIKNQSIGSIIMM